MPCNSNIADCCLHNPLTNFLYANRPVGRPREHLREPKLIEIPEGASPDEIKKIQNRNYQKKWRFKQTHLKSENEIEE